jgi:hypothetical protein
VTSMFSLDSATLIFRCHANQWPLGLRRGSSLFKHWACRFESQTMHGCKTDRVSCYGAYAMENFSRKAKA